MSKLFELICIVAAIVIGAVFISKVADGSTKVGAGIDYIFGIEAPAETEAPQMPLFAD